MTKDQQEFYDAMATAILYSTKHLGEKHTANLQRTYNKFCKDMGVPTPQQLADKILNKTSQHNFTLPEIDLCPASIPDKWDDIEIESVHIGANYCELVDEYDDPNDPESEVNCYSVYLHSVSGGVQCIADCTSLAQAEKLARLIAKAAENYKDDTVTAQRRRRNPKTF